MEEIEEKPFLPQNMLSEKYHAMVSKMKKA